jgi:hypothetical protein
MGRRASSRVDGALGIGTGVLVQEVNGLPAAERATGSNLVTDFTDNIFVRDFGVFNVIGSLSLITATIAAGIALRRQAGVPLSVPILLGLCGFMIAAHPPPFGPIGLVFFVAAVLLYARSQTATRTPAPLAQPHPTYPDAIDEATPCPHALKSRA